MDEIITPADIRALRNDLIAPTQTFIRVLSASQDRDIQQELLKKHIYSVTLTNGVYTFAKTEHKVSTLTKNIITRLLYRIVMFYIDNGTSSKMQTSSRYIMFVQTDATTGSSAKSAVLGAILVSDLQAAIKTVTVHTRRWMRRYADVAFDLLETYFPSHTPALMTKWAFAPEDRSVAFDFADGITTSKLTARQVAAISASKGANFARDAAFNQQTINLSYTYHQGMLGTMTPARRLLPQAPP